MKTFEQFIEKTFEEGDWITISHRYVDTHLYDFVDNTPAEIVVTTISSDDVETLHIQFDSNNIPEDLTRHDEGLFQVDVYDYEGAMENRIQYHAKTKEEILMKMEAGKYNI